MRFMMEGSIGNVKRREGQVMRRYRQSWISVILRPDVGRRTPGAATPKHACTLSRKTGVLINQQLCGSAQSSISAVCSLSPLHSATAICFAAFGTTLHASFAVDVFLAP